MTYEEVKKIRENPTSEHCEITELQEKIDLAVDKQIPMKPTGLQAPNADKGYCPRCGGKQIGHQRRHVSFIDDYCHDCGQALDWSESDLWKRKEHYGK